MRLPEVEDGGRIWRFVREAGVLELNSAYSYLMMCKYFRDTCIVAEVDRDLVGFVVGFRPPAQPDGLFVWQVGVSPSQRGRGVGIAMLHGLLEREANRSVRFVEATVAPSNQPSQALFRRLARDWNTRCEVLDGFPEHLFPQGGHEAEPTLRIGPMDRT